MSTLQPGYPIPRSRQARNSPGCTDFYRYECRICREYSIVDRFGGKLHACSCEDQEAAPDSLEVWHLVDGAWVSKGLMIDIAPRIKP